MSNFTSAVNQKVQMAFSKHSMLLSCKKIVVGFSGGADSVCLLHVLNSLKEQYNFNLIAAHVNHGLRGNEAIRDAEFAAEFSESYSIPFQLLSVDCNAEASKTGESTEECGRRIRYNFFESLCDNETKVATAHNSNDNAETVLFNIIRGASLSGACGIPAVRDNIIRPLLYCSRQEIEGYCSENNLDFVTDSSNLTDDYSRNKIRHLVIPVLEEINSRAVKNLNKFSANATEANNFITGKAKDALSVALIADNKYNAEYLFGLEEVICKRCLVIAFGSFSEKSLDNKKIEAIYKLLENGGRIQLYGDVYVEVVKGVLRFFKYSDCDASKTISIDLDTAPVTYQNSCFTVSVEKYTNSLKKVNKLLLDNLIDCDKISGKICFRTRNAGDSITLPRRRVSKSLKKLYCENNIPVELRDQIPVLADDCGVVWVHSIGVCERCRVDESSTNIVYVRGENNE